MKLNIHRAKSKTQLLVEEIEAFVSRVYRNHTGRYTYTLRDMLERKRHLQKFPAMQLDSHITKRDKAHWIKPPYLKAFTGTGRHNKFGKGQVFFTMREGGYWQKWPWNWVPEPHFLQQVVEDGMSYMVMRDQFNLPRIRITHPFKKKGNITVYAHSMLIDGRRWDCINGWNN